MVEFTDEMQTCIPDPLSTIDRQINCKGSFEYHERTRGVRFNSKSFGCKAWLFC